MTAEQIPVLVVGAGPTGLMMAIELARRGVAVRIVERLTEPPLSSRALVVQPRTLELFDDIGVVEEALAAGRPVDHLVQVPPGHPPIRLDFRAAQWAAIPRLRTTYPQPLMLPQDRTERILTGHLSSLGITVERGVTFEGFQRQDDTVRAELRGPGGRREAVSARWLVGADGAHSRVRHAAGIPFPGATYPEEFIQADVRLDWELPDGELYIFPRPDGMLGVWTMPGTGRFRILGNVPPARDPDGENGAGSGHGAGSPGEPTVAEMQALLDARLPIPARIVDTTWTARYRLHRRGVPRYRDGRVFLAGDAAHIHSPAGGRA